MKRTQLLSWLLIAIISMSGATAYAAPKKKEKKKGKTEQVETPPETAYKGKIGHLYAQKNKKDLHIHAQRNEGCSLHPS